MKDPCVNCPQEKGGCQWTCPIGIARQRRAAEKREQARIARNEEAAIATYKFDRIQDTKKKIGE